VSHCCFSLFFPFSDPQVYINGELIGGLDVVKEMVANNEFASAIPPGHIKAAANKNMEDRLKAIINQRRIMIFMKGSPSAPQCGFSNKAVALLRECGLQDGEFGHFDIFSDSEVREGLKTYSNWPTYPQLYVDGELLGGLDVMNEMKEGGELSETINKVIQEEQAKKATA
jgi:Grx4 family monothiol glutaredoxin